MSLRIAQDTGEANVAKEMKSSLDNCSNLFAQVDKNLPLILNRNKTLLGHLQRFDEDVQKCHLWLNEAKQTLNRYSILVPLKRIEEFLEQNRVRNRNEKFNERETFSLFFLKNFVARMELHRPIIENLRRLVESMKRIANESRIPMNFAAVDDQCRQTNDHFQVKQKARRKVKKIDFDFTSVDLGNRTTSESLG